MAHILRIKTEIYNLTDPIIGSYQIISGKLRVGAELKTTEGNLVGTVGKILSGSIMYGHKYVQEAGTGEKVGLLIFSNKILTEKESHLVASV
jgi:translation initiation factor IF-2